MFQVFLNKCSERKFSFSSLCSLVWIEQAACAHYGGYVVLCELGRMKQVQHAQVQHIENLMGGCKPISLH
jgi:hypothetical protein